MSSGAGPTGRRSASSASWPPESSSSQAARWRSVRPVTKAIRRASERAWPDRPAIRPCYTAGYACEARATSHSGSGRSARRDPADRMDDIFQQIGATIGGFFDSAPVRLGIQAIAIYFVILWLAAAYWAFRDMQLRTENPILPYLAAAFIIVFTPIFFPLAVFVYRIVRPQEKIGEVYERNLAEEALLAEVEAVKSCPTCARRVNDEWIICPTCRTRLNRVCPNCSRLVGLDWSLCAWCGKDFERHDLAALEPLQGGLDHPDALPEPMRPAVRPTSVRASAALPRS